MEVQVIQQLGKLYGYEVFFPSDVFLITKRINKQ